MLHNNERTASKYYKLAITQKLNFLITSIILRVQSMCTNILAFIQKKQNKNLVLNGTISCIKTAFREVHRELFSCSMQQKTLERTTPPNIVQ